MRFTFVFGKGANGDQTVRLAKVRQLVAAALAAVEADAVFTAARSGNHCAVVGTAVAADVVVLRRDFDAVAHHVRVRHKKCGFRRNFSRHYRADHPIFCAGRVPRRKEICHWFSPSGSPNSRMGFADSVFPDFLFQTHKLL
jgi:hypothetical protein